MQKSRIQFYTLNVNRIRIYQFGDEIKIAKKVCKLNGIIKYTYVI